VRAEQPSEILSLIMYLGWGSEFHYLETASTTRITFCRVTTVEVSIVSCPLTPLHHKKWEDFDRVGQFYITHFSPNVASLQPHPKTGGARQLLNHLY
jgi:hypothetical protein